MSKTPKPKVVVFLPVKANSQRVKKDGVSKNLMLLDGKPLFLHTLEKLASMNYFDEVILDTESEQVMKMAENVRCKIFKRDQALANNATDGNALLFNEALSTDAEIIVQILCTSPFIKESTIIRAVNILIEDSNCDSVVLCQKTKQYTWDSEKPNYNIDKIPNSIDLDDTFIETMGLYAIRRKTAIENKRRIGLNPKMIFADPTEAIDVNFPEDFELAETIAAGKREKDRLLLNNLKGLMSSPFLSDIFDDIGISSKQVVSGLKSNINDGKLIGRAKTLKLRKLKEGEDWRGIYNALKSYKSVVTNDVIVVQNDCPDLAYFGELNANIATRCGASGAIIGGKTRDSQKVKQLGFVTFSQGFVAKDVRKRATLENFDVNIDLFGATVQPGDLIFGDVEGIVVIPKEFEEAVINEVFVRLKNENDIVSSIAKGYDVKDLVDNYGQF